MASVLTLWTWQTKGHDINNDSYAREKSEYFKEEYIQRSYDRLFDLIDASETIWCTTERDKWINCSSPHSAPHRVEWKIEISHDNILRYIDPMIWNRIIEERSTLPHTGFLNHVKTHVWDNYHPDEWNENIQKQIDEYNLPYDEMSEPERWNKLFCPASQRWADVIIRYPPDGEARLVEQAR